MSNQSESAEPKLQRKVGFLQATALNMSQMCGVGPFITIPAMVVVFGGPQAILGWIAGALLSLCDGLIWCELGAAMPGSGGTYVYLREAFQYRTGKLMPFLFVWTAILYIPLIMSTGVIGFVQYLGYLAPGMSGTLGTVVGLAIIALVFLLLWQNIKTIGKITVGLWGVMILTVVLVIVACFSHFNGAQVFDFPSGAFDIQNGGFWVALTGGLTVGVYDYQGYNTTSYMGAEIEKPGRTIPRSVIFSVLGMMVVYLLMQIGTLGVVPWREMTNTGSQAYSSIASVVLQRSWGTAAADVVTVLILITAFASFFIGLLSGSRVPYEAARDGVFLKQFSILHKKKDFPIYGVIIMVVMTALGFLIGRNTSITVLIQLLTTVMVIVQSFGQVAAIVILRRRQPKLNRPYKMWLYPIPLIVAAVGWVSVYLYADANAPGLHPIELSVGWVVIGVVIFLIWAKTQHIWPFGPKEIRERYLEAQEESNTSNV